MTSNLLDVQPFPAYKASGVEWIGDVSEHWKVPTSIEIGYKTSFTRYYYNPQPLGSPEEVRAGILAVERATKDLLPATLGEPTYG